MIIKNFILVFRINKEKVTIEIIRFKYSKQNKIL